MNVIDSYRIIGGPYGRNLDAEANWLSTFVGPVEVWSTWTLACGDEVRCWRPLNATELVALRLLLERAAHHTEDTGIQLVQGYDLGEVAEPYYTVLGQVTELYIEVRG